MSEVKFSLELYQDIHEEMDPILMKHFLEISANQDIPLDVDKEQYFMLEKVGILKVYTARYEGKLIGYSVYFVRHNPHYRKSLQAAQDVIFIDPERRGFGKKFINWCDDQLRDYGVQVVYHHVKQKHNFGPMLETMGYKLVDLVYGRRLDKEF